MHLQVHGYGSGFLDKDLEQSQTSAKPENKTLEDPKSHLPLTLPLIKNTEPQGLTQARCLTVCSTETTPAWNTWSHLTGSHVPGMQKSPHPRSKQDKKEKEKENKKPPYHFL